MIDKQYPREVGVAHRPDGKRQRLAPTQQKFHSLHERPILVASQNRGQALNHIEGSNVMSPTFKVSPGYSPKAPPTDKDIMNFIEKRLAPYRATSTHQSRKVGATPINEKTPTNGDTDSCVPKSENVIHLPSSFSNEENAKRQNRNVSTEQHTATRGKPLKYSSSNSNANAALMFKPQLSRDCTTVVSDKHSTEYPELMRNFAAMCPKTEDASPVNFTAESEMILDKPSEKNASARLLTCISAQEDHRSSWLSKSKTLDNTDTLKSVTNPKNRETGPKTMEADCLKGVTNTSVAFQTNSISASTQHDTMCLKTLGAMGVNEKNGKLNSTLYGKVKEVPNQPCVQVSQCRDMNEDEEPQVKTETVATISSIQGPQNKHTSYSPSSVFKGNEADYQMEDADDEWLVVPVNMVDIDFEPENRDQQDVEMCVSHPEKTGVEGQWNVHQPDSDPTLAVAPSGIEMFDTFDSFLKAKSEQFSFCKSTLPDELDSDAEPFNAQDIKESDSAPEDSCETEDSCDYSSASERNRLTVDSSLLKEVSEIKGRNPQTRSSRLDNHIDPLAATNESRKNVSEIDDIIVLDSDTDDDLHCEIINLDSDTDSGSVTGHLAEDDVHIQPETNKPTITENTDFHDLDKVVKKDQTCKEKQTVERTVSSASDDGVYSTSLQNEFDTTTVNRHTNRKRPQKTASKSPSTDSSDSLPHTVSKKAHPDPNPEPVIGRLFVKVSSQPGGYLNLSKDSKDRLDKDEQKTHTTTKSAFGNDRNNTAKKLSSSVTKPKQSPSNQEDPFSFIGNSTQLQFPRARKISASEGVAQSLAASARSSVPRPKPGTSVPTQQSSTSKVKCPEALTKDLPTCTRSVARKQIESEWSNHHVPTKMDKKSSPGTEIPHRKKRLRTTKSKTPRHRHIPNKSATPLMKRTKQEAIQRTKDINRMTSSGQSNIMGKHYKWAEKKPVKVASSRKRRRL